jgi:alpha-tubulin suppressor-like RCC1 family protein
MEAFHTASAVVESNGAGLMLTASGGVFPWGSAAAEIPPPMPVKPTALAVGYAHRAALLENGTVVCWGDNSWGQCDVPFVLSVPGIARAREIALGEVHCFAVTTAGDLHYWGYDENPIPPGFTATAVASGAVHLLALRSDGTVSGWRGTPVPADLGNVTKIAAGYWHSVALRANGVVQCWGRDSQGECNVPPDLGPVRDIAGYREGTAALTADGRVVVWGGYIASQAYPGPPATRISGGPLASSIVATLDTDCNADGVPDSTQLDQQDCDGNGILDACDIQMGMMEDCNGNAISDACEKQLQIDLSSGPIGPIGYQQSVAWTIPRATLAAAPFTLRIRGRGDFGGQLEAISISLGNLNLGTALAGTADCVVTAWQQFTGTDFALNSALDTEGNLTIRADATIAVDSGLCPGGTWLEFELSYMGATAADCNANGLLDSCEIGNGWAVDTNGNGVIDLCESAFVSCPADFDQDGFVRSSDLAQLLNAWGPVPGLPGVDLVPDGVVDGSDLAVLLGAWGVCVE